MVSMGRSEATVMCTLSKRPFIPYWGGRGGEGGGAFKGAKLVKQNTVGWDPLVMHQYFTMNTFADSSKRYEICPPTLVSVLIFDPINHICFIFHRNPLGCVFCTLQWDAK